MSVTATQGDIAGGTGVLGEGEVVTPTRARCLGIRQGGIMAISVVERRIDEWKQKLIDPSRRNRLIYFRPSKSSTLTIGTPDGETVFNRLVV